jgi:hypothetical protein
MDIDPMQLFLHPIRLLDLLRPAVADRRRWRAEEEDWRQSDSFPLRIVRVYRSQRQLRRDARHLRRLGYAVHFQATSNPRSGDWRWYVTYDRQ